MYVKSSKINDLDDKVCSYVSFYFLVATPWVTALLIAPRLTHVIWERIIWAKKQLLLLCENGLFLRYGIFMSQQYKPIRRFKIPITELCCFDSTLKLALVIDIWILIINTAVCEIDYHLLKLFRNIEDNPWTIKSEILTGEGLGFYILQVPRIITESPPIEIFCFKDTFGG